MGFQMLEVDKDSVKAEATCDKCGASKAAKRETAERAEATLNLQGWVTRNYDLTYRVTCPECSRRSNRQNGHTPS